LTPGEDAMYQYLDPNGANRIIYLATSTAKAGDRFVIRNNGAYNSSYYLSIKQGGTELDRIYAGAIKEFIFDGTNWISASNGSGENDDKKYNVAIGTYSIGYYYGAAVGYEAQGYKYGAAVGFGADGYTSGAAVGYNAEGYNYGAAVGYYADGVDHGAAVGRGAKGCTSGAAVGDGAEGFNYGAAVGAYAQGMRYGAALGYFAGSNIDTSADRYNIVIGAFSGYRLTYGTSNIIIGYKAGEDSTYSPTTGSNNILIGTKAWTPTTSTSDFLNIGGLIFGTGLSREPNTLASGNVGIGVSNPAYKLQVAGDIVPSSDNAYDLGKSNLRWAHLYAASTTVGDLIFNNNFRIVETQPEEEIQGIVIKNQKNETIATFKENGELKLEGGISLGNENSPTGITLYDKITKKPYCLEIANGEIVIREGKCQR
ncbi:phage tail tape measure protein, partial [bacterium]|nr:phage tail tape measure protein [bacterium]